MFPAVWAGDCGRASQARGALQSPILTGFGVEGHTAWAIPHASPRFAVPLVTPRAANVLYNGGKGKEFLRRAGQRRPVALHPGIKRDKVDKNTFTFDVIGPFFCLLWEAIIQMNNEEQGSRIDLRANLGTRRLPKLRMADFPNADDIVRRGLLEEERGPDAVDIMLVNPPTPDGQLWIRTQHRV